MARLTCPYCFEVLPADAPWAFRCRNADPKRCPPEQDVKLEAYERRPIVPYPRRVFEVKPKRSLFDDAPRADGVCQCGTDNCGRVCPKCHNDLPSDVGQTESISIALIGGKEVGKSQYIGVLVNTLMHGRIGPDFNASLGTLGEPTRIRYAQRFHRHLYENGETIPATMSGAADLDTRRPLIFRFSIEQKRLGIWTEIRVTNLVFFDAAGEDLSNIDLMSTEARYITNCDGLIFLLDPLQLKAVRDRVPREVPLPANVTDPLNIVTRVAELARLSKNRRSSNEKLPLPVALAFSKIDAVTPLFSPQSPIRRASNHRGFFDVEDAERVSADVRAQVMDWSSPALEQFMKHNFQTYSYFGVSSLGAAPTSDGRLTGAVSPFRVEDPFLWLLYKLGLIKAGKQAGA